MTRAITILAAFLTVTWMGAAQPARADHGGARADHGGRVSHTAHDASSDLRDIARRLDQRATHTRQEAREVTYTRGERRALALLRDLEHNAHRFRKLIARHGIRDPHLLRRAFRELEEGYRQAESKARRFDSRDVRKDFRRVRHLMMALGHEVDRTIRMAHRHPRHDHRHHAGPDLLHNDRHDPRYNDPRPAGHGYDRDGHRAIAWHR